MHNPGVSPIKTRRSKVNNIVAKYPVKILPPIIRESDYETVNKIVQCLYVNSTTLPTTLGRDINVHIRLIMNPTLYTMIVYNVYVALADLIMVPNILVKVMEMERAQ